MFCKRKDDAEKESRRIKFSVASYVESLRHIVGEEIKGCHEMMWEREFLEFAKTPKVGLISEEQWSH